MPKNSRICPTYASDDGNREAISGKRKLLPLRPKTDINTPHPCGLRACRQPVCNLVSHHRHATFIKQKRLARGEHVKFEACSDQERALPTPPLEPTIANGGGFPVLPFDDIDPRVARRLFHDFFAKLVDKIHMVLVPPGGSQSNLAWMESRRETLFRAGSISSLDCLNYIVSSYNHLAPMSAIEQLPDTVAFNLQGILIRNLRVSLDNYQPQDSLQVLTTIFTLVMFDVAIGRTSSLFAHRTAMVRVVDSRGGLHNHEWAIPFILNMDKNIATHMGLEPLYTTWSSVTTPIHRASYYPETYGSFFANDRRRETLDNDLIVYCAETCRAIEILEGERWNFRQDRYKDCPEIHFLYFLRSRLSGKFAHLNARFFHSASRERCILLAAKLVEYIVLMDNIMPAVPASHAQKLCEVLRAQATDDIWVDWQDILTWIISVLVSIPVQWKGRSWILNLHQSRLTDKYGKRWPDDLQKEQVCHMNTFVWSATRLDHRLISESRVVYEDETCTGSQ